MKNSITEVVFILDASGSMVSLTEDTIGGFNSMIKEQSKSQNKVLVNTVIFNSEHKTIHDRIDIKDVPLLSEEEYVARGGTALLDAMGDTISHISKIHKYIRKEDIPSKTLVVITTDGMENSSYKYNVKEIRKMVEAKTELGWDFIFMGANMDAISTANSYGIKSDYAVRYCADKKGTKKVFGAMEKVINNVANCCEIDLAWKEEIEIDEQ